MGLTSRLLRLPRPKTFLYTMSLTTGASLITLSLLLNKVSGLYGLLALLTGFELNSLQLSMYIYSLLALALTAYLAPHIRTQSPLHCLALAWFYTLDSVINAAYTAAFSVTWFLVLAQHNAGKKPGDMGPGAGTIDDTSGFTNPKHNVSSVEVVPGMPDSPPPSYSAEDDGAVMVGTPASFPAGTDATGSGSGNLAHSVLQPESINSLGVIVALWTIRLYFCVVMLSYARMVLRQHVMLASIKNNTYTSASTDSGMAENPFARCKPEGQGWKGRLGRLMIAFPRQYWLGGSDDEERAQDISWMDGMGGKFRQGGSEAAAAADGRSSSASGNANVVESGPLERERRRRSGTGPPPPHVQLSTPGQKGLSVPLQDLK